MNAMDFLGQMASIFQNVLMLAALIGGIFVFRSTKKTGLIKIQTDTIEALQSQINALKEQNTQQQKKLDQQDFEMRSMDFEMKSMREALKDEGIFITMDGEKITIKNANQPDTTKHIIKKTSVRKTVPPIRKEIP
jgi:FtsZ-binding cell division protein ZapB